MDFERNVKAWKPEKGNTLILGKYGSGKSYLAKQKIKEIVNLDPNSIVIVIDAFREYSSLIKTLQGDVISFSSTSVPTINAHSNIVCYDIYDIFLKSHDSIITILENLSNHLLQNDFDGKSVYVFIENFSSVLTKEKGVDLISTLWGCDRNRAIHYIGIMQDKECILHNDKLKNILLSDSVSVIDLDGKLTVCAL